MKQRKIERYEQIVREHPKLECPKTHWCEICLDEFCEICAEKREPASGTILVCPRKVCQLKEPQTTLVPHPTNH